jgi:hypothetical protein
MARRKWRPLEERFAVASEERPWMGERAERLERHLQVPMLVAAVLVIPDLVLEESHVGATGKAIATAPTG